MHHSSRLLISIKAYVRGKHLILVSIDTGGALQISVASRYRREIGKGKK